MLFRIVIGIGISLISLWIVLKAINPSQPKVYGTNILLKLHYTYNGQKSLLRIIRLFDNNFKLSLLSDLQLHLIVTEITKQG